VFLLRTRVFEPARRAAVIPLVVAVATAVSVARSAADEPPLDWPQWRGPLATGEAPDADPPLLTGLPPRWEGRDRRLEHEAPRRYFRNRSLTALAPSETSAATVREIKGARLDQHSGSSEVSYSSSR
jgi:hypothetical protein